MQATLCQTRDVHGTLGDWPTSRSKETRHRGTGAAGWHSDWHRTQGQIAKGFVALGKVAVEAVGSLNPKKPKHFKREIADWHPPIAPQAGALSNRQRAIGS
jgi:hypothetical protein